MLKAFASFIDTEIVRFVTNCLSHPQKALKALKGLILIDEYLYERIKIAMEILRKLSRQMEIKYYPMVERH